ncbi:MAG: 5-formyltetrahydrofolate cyclo-ligase [Candidatus Thermoplasmatota archaeon]
MNLDKKNLRAKLKKKRDSLLYNDVITKSRLIAERLYKLDDYKQSYLILFYVSYDNEVYTHEMIKETLRRGKRIVVPYIYEEDKKMILSELLRWEDLTPGPYNILQPLKDKIRVINIDNIDIIIVPGLGFDIRGNRIGHGLGYYDALLKKARNKNKYGLAFESQLLDHIPSEPHDIKVDYIITEERIIKCC